MWNIVQRKKQLASSHSLSLILTLFLFLLLNLSPLFFLSSSVLHSFSHRRWHSSCHRGLKRGWLLFFNMIHLSLICSEWIMHCVTHGVTENVFSWIFSAFFYFPEAEDNFFLKSSPSTVSDNFITGHLQVMP